MMLCACLDQRYADKAKVHDIRVKRGNILWVKFEDTHNSPTGFPQDRVVVRRSVTAHVVLQTVLFRDTPDDSWIGVSIPCRGAGRESNRLG